MYIFYICMCSDSPMYKYKKKLQLSVLIQIVTNIHKNFKYEQLKLKNVFDSNKKLKNMN